MTSRGSAPATVDRLGRIRDTFTAPARHAQRQLLEILLSGPVPDGRALLPLHETLCFLRAHPDDATVLALVDRALAGFAARVAEASPRERQALEATGVAGTVVRCPFSLPVVRWLASRFPGRVAIDWGDPEDAARVGTVLALALPPLAEAALVEADVPYRAWLEAGRGGAPSDDLRWLLERLDAAGLTGEVWSVIEGGLDLPVRWELGDSPASRTHARVGAGPIVFVRGPLRRVRGPLHRHLPGPPVRVRRLGRGPATVVLDAARAAVAVRAREVHAFTFASPDDVVVADVGRGVRVAWFGVELAHRLPLRAHYGYLVVRNGVPVGYGDASILLDRVEIAFNVFEAFRRGESAWIFVRLLAFLGPRFGVRHVLLDPYQIGAGNAEAIASGAFWFYDKLGFRSVRADLRRLAAAERRRRAGHPGHRSSPETLERLCQAAMLASTRGPVDPAMVGFDVQHLGRLAAARVGRGDLAEVARSVARALGSGRFAGWSAGELEAFRRLAPVLALVPDLAGWPAADRRALLQAIRAKGGRDEREYVRRVRTHRRLRAALLRL